ncbi:MAG: extracellular solute-binding protein [Verrucomicrobiales bacterium]|jgi:raffinose/stachyose/melibiose transport system substrate-binding protein|nr:extracellular solute-binding protein [Verrucomicrobiales bacterium]
MNREKILNTVGFTLLGLCFLSALYSVIFRSVRDADPNLITIRFAHWQLEGGLRGTFDDLARQYEKICADRGQKVRVEQVTIPESVFGNWVLTQLVGGTAPQIIELGSMHIDRKARFFESLSGYVNEPNPYNAGTPLAGLPWRNTFVDGMLSTYDKDLLDYYSVPLSLFTVRLFYNKPLYEKIFGQDAPPPKDYRDFVRVCLAIQQYGQEHGLGIVPVAGSKYNEGQLTGRIAGSQTQKLNDRLNRKRTASVDGNELYVSYLREQWGPRSPEIISSLRLTQSFYQFFQPGFQQVDRDSGTLYFIQSRCVFICTGSWDNTSFRIQAPFEIGVCDLPLPTKDDPEYGQYMKGPFPELSRTVGMGFGIVRGTPHTDMALDFLKFLTSYRGSEYFTKHSGWLPAIMNVPVDDQLKPFEPHMDGYPNGFGLALPASNNQAVLMDNTAYLLQKYPDSPEAFLEAYEQLDAFSAITNDLKLWLAAARRSIVRADTLLAANRALARGGSGIDSSAGRKFYELLEQQIQTEADAYSYEMEMTQIWKERVKP